jgi:hypothetical protein
MFDVASRSFVESRRFADASHATKLLRTSRQRAFAASEHTIGFLTADNAHLPRKRAMEHIYATLCVVLSPHNTLLYHTTLAL